MMKKHNEGYTLPLVMVVLLVLAIVAVTIMTTSLKNMLRQQDFIEKMEDQYKAQGMIEEIVAKLAKAEGTSSVQDVLDDYKLQAGEGNETTEGEINSSVGTENVVNEWNGEPIRIWAYHGSIRIECEIRLTEKKKDDAVIGYEISYSAYSISPYTKTTTATNPEGEAE